jgi:hypothetical protein
MDAQLNVLSSTASNPLSIGENQPSAAGKRSGEQAMLGQEFANLMRSLLPESERQDLATVTTVATSSGLKTQHLGTQFDLITSTSPQPDEDSLAAFAKSQGLADSAVQALFGNLQPLSEKAMQLASAGMNLHDSSNSAKPVDALAQNPPSLESLTMLNQAPGWFVSPPSASLPTTTTPLRVAAGDASAAPALLVGDADGTALGTPSALGTWPWLTTPGDPRQLATLPTSPNQASLASDPAALSKLLSAHSAHAIIKTQGPVNPASPSVLGEMGTDPSNVDPSSWDAMRMRLVPAWENMTRQLANANGNGQALIWANLANGWVGKDQKLGSADGVIDLSDSPIGAKTDTGDGLGTVSATFNNDNSAQMARTGDQAPSLNLSGRPLSADTAAPAPDRAAQISQLADKLGQALSERLQNQIEQGQWKMELRLKPAHLGKISVELDMNASGLDAIFKTDNAMTRDLIAQGTQRLRDNLTQAGMTVANVWVNSHQQQSTGGNSTPRQQSGTTPPMPLEAVEAVDVKKVPNVAKSSDGWDQLV